jgi:hypothetical protein
LWERVRAPVWERMSGEYCCCCTLEVHRGSSQQTLKAMCKKLLCAVAVRELSTAWQYPFLCTRNVFILLTMCNLTSYNSTFHLIHNFSASVNFVVNGRKKESFLVWETKKEKVEKIFSPRKSEFSFLLINAREEMIEEN